MKKLALLLSLLSVVFIAGCGENIFEGQEDKNTTEAERFDISDDLDSGNYLSVLNNPDATATEYAEAAMGLAGLDPVGLVKAMNDMAESNDENDLSAVTSLSINPDALQYLQEAEDMLSSEQQAACAADPNSQECHDLSFQMTLTSLTSTITALAQVGQENVSGFDATDGGISDAEATALGNYIAANTAVQVDTNGDDTADTSLVTIIDSDVTNVVTTLPNSGLGADSDLYQVLSETTQGLWSLNYDDTGSVSPTDISNYLTNVLGQ